MLFLFIVEQHNIIANLGTFFMSHPVYSCLFTLDMVAILSAERFTRRPILYIITNRTFFVNLVHTNQYNVI